MIDSIQTFGDSFLFGSDLSDSDENTYSRSTWPALIADELDLEYKCHAQGGRGNNFISVNVLLHANPDSLNIINWSWIERFDYWIDQDNETPLNMTLRPDGDDLSKFYFKNLHHEIGDKFLSLSFIHSTHCYLKKHNIPFISTFMDQQLLDNTNYTHCLWITNLQKEIQQDLKTFPGGQTFLEWSRANGYPESKGWHPLELAHEKAAEYWLPIYEKAINTHITTK